MSDLYKDKQCEDGVLAYGEASGHAHQFEDLDSAEIFKSREFPDQLFVKVKKPTRLIHGRARGFTGKEADHDYHAPIQFPAGKEYVIGIVKETDWLTRTIRKVVD